MFLDKQVLHGEVLTSAGENESKFSIALKLMWLSLDLLSNLASYHQFLHNDANFTIQNIYLVGQLEN